MAQSQSVKPATGAKITRRIPPKGITLPQGEVDDIVANYERFEDELSTASITDERSINLLPDVELFEKAIRLARTHGEFYKKGDVKIALDLIKRGRDRLNALKDGKAPWLKQRVVVVRGYRSTIDGSAQPYVLEIPEGLDLSKPVPLYVWLHGRGDKTTDMHFIHRTRSSPISKPLNGKKPTAIILHPFGRHCMGFKSAGEIDVLDAIDHVKKNYRIDDRRIVLMGFSMGGAGAWHIGAHYTDRFVAMSAGAGFAETARYIRLPKEKYPPWYEQKLWGIYDVPNYTRNLFNLPVVAYSGENDKQIQAARVMEEAFKSHGRTLPHLIGPGMGHKYHPDSIEQIVATMQKAVAKGLDRKPKKVTLQTRTLRYNRMHWVEVEGLEEHWQDTRVDAEQVKKDEVHIATKNVTRLAITLGDDMADWKFVIDGQALTVPQYRNLVRRVPFAKVDGQWKEGANSPRDKELRKRPGLQGPIDDAFLGPFLVLRPSRRSDDQKVGQRIRNEFAHLHGRWQALYRGSLPTVREPLHDGPVDENLVVFGTPQNSDYLAAIMKHLPFKWDGKAITYEIAGNENEDGVKRSFSARHHMLVMIYPNPLNPSKYVVINSGPTFREGHDRTNSLQNPKLPDWAIVDVREPATDLAPGKVVDAGFFDENWQLKARK